MSNSLRIPVILAGGLSGIILFLSPVPPAFADISRPSSVNREATYHARARVWVLNQNGHQIVWYEDGVKKAEGDFERSQREGSWKFYFPGGKLKGEGDFKGNLKHGFWQIYHSSGKKKAAGTYIKNKKHGEWTTWYSNGQMETRGQYNQGNREGEWTNYYESGRVFYTGSYKNDMAHGEWQYFYKNGKPYQQGAYSKDVRVGKWKICVFPGGPCQTEFFENPATPRKAEIPDEDNLATPAYDPSNPAGLLESLDKGGVPDEVPPSLRGKDAGW